MRLQTVVVAVLLFSLTVVTMTSGLTSFVTEYNADAGTVDIDRLNQLDQINETITDISDSLQEKNKSFFLEDTFNAFVKSGFSTAKLVFGTIPVISEITVALIDVFPVDPIIPFTLLSLVIALIGFAFISAIFKWRL